VEIQEAPASVLNNFCQSFRLYRRVASPPRRIAQRETTPGEILVISLSPRCNIILFHDV